MISCSVITDEKSPGDAFSGFTVCISGFAPAFFSTGEVALIPWDVAAGAIIVQEAGGMVTEFNGGDNFVFGEDLVCTNGVVHSEMLDVIKQFFP